MESPEAEPIEPPSPHEIEDLILRHAPPGSTPEELRRLAQSIHEGREFYFLVLAADIRNSTLVQKEAVNFRLHAEILSRFVEASADAVRVIHGGWFDKFTGDGFLAYWLLGLSLDGGGAPPLSVVINNATDGNPWTQIQSALNCSLVLHSFFDDRAMRDFRLNSRNLPAGTGLAIGMDAGPAYFATVAGDLTILGAPIVGAVRMVTAAAAGESVVNVHLGRAIQIRAEQEHIFGFASVQTEMRNSKEYPGGQEVYILGPDPEDWSRLDDLAAPPAGRGE